VAILQFVPVGAVEAYVGVADFEMSASVQVAQPTSTQVTLVTSSVPENHLAVSHAIEAVAKLGDKVPPPAFVNWSTPVLQVSCSVLHPVLPSVITLAADMPVPVTREREVVQLAQSIGTQLAPWTSTPLSTGQVQCASPLQITSVGDAVCCTAPPSVSINSTCLKAGQVSVA